MKTPTFIILLTGLLTAGATHAVDNATWGQVKNEQLNNSQTDAFAAKASKNASKNGKKNSKKDQSVSTQTKESNHIQANYTDVGGHFSVKRGQEFEKESGDFKIKFKVPKGAVGAKTKIDMIVNGDRASNLEIVFGPSGLVFDEECTLQIELGPSFIDIDLNALDPYHAHGDGSVDSAGIKSVVVHDDGGVTVEVKVPGFSRYGMWRGR